MIKNSFPKLNKFAGLKICGAIFAFVILGTGIAEFSGITNNIAKIFYQPGDGRVAGESAVRIAALPSLYEEFMRTNGGRVTTFDERKQQYLNDDGNFFQVHTDHEYQGLWAWLEKNETANITNGVNLLLGANPAFGWTDHSCRETCEVNATAYRAMKHPNIGAANRDRIYQKYANEVNLLRTDPKNSAFDGNGGNIDGDGVRNFNQVLQYTAGLYLFLQDNPSLNGSFIYDHFDYGGATPWGWKDFIFSGRSYARGGSYANLLQFLEDYLMYHADWYVRNNFEDYEGDSRNYGWTHINAYIQLYDFAQNATVKNKAKMLLDFMMLDQGMEFSADQTGGKTGRKDNDSQGKPDYYVRKKDEPNYHCILTGLGCSYPAAYKPDYNIYLTTYRVPTVVQDLVDISDEPDTYWHEQKEYNQEVHEPNKGKVTFVTKFYNLGGGDNQGGQRYGWLLNIKSNDTDLSGYPIGLPFRLWTRNTQPRDIVRDYASNETPGGEFYHYRNALWSPEIDQFLHIFTAEDQDNYLNRLGNLDYYEEVGNRYYLQEGRVMAVVEMDSSHSFVEVAIAGVDYADMNAFRNVFTGGQKTSKGVTIGKSASGDATINGSAAYSYPFDRMEATDNQGNKMIDWNNKVMALNKHGQSCAYDFNNWTVSGACGSVAPPPPQTCQQMGGFTCQTGQTCPGTWLANLCCSVACQNVPAPTCPYNICQAGDSCSEWYNNNPGSLCCVNACNGAAMGTNWNPPYPRVSFQYPSPETHFTACQEIYPKFDLLANNFENPASCPGDIKAKNPQIILLATMRDMMEAGGYFEYNTYRYFDPQTAESVNAAAAVDLKVTNTNGDGFPRWEINLCEADGYCTIDRLTRCSQDGDCSMNLPYGRWGSSGFIVGPSRTAGRISYSPDRFSYGYNDRNYRTHVDERGGILHNTTGVDASHPANSYIRLPIKTAGWLYNITAANPYGGTTAAEYFINQERLAGKNASNFQYYDGGHYATYRFDWILNGYDGDGSANHVANTVDFDMNWESDYDEHGLDWINNQWHGTDTGGNPTSAGLYHMWNYEKQQMSSIKGGGAKTVVVVNSGFCAFPSDGAVNWLDGFQLEAGIPSCYSWNLAFDKFRLWDKPNKYIIAIDGSISWDAAKYASYKNRFSDMRFGLTTTLMGNAFYGRNVGPYFYFGLLYDEYETQLGYPTSEPQKISGNCVTRNGQQYCPYVRFFDDGAVIVNPTFQSITINESDIDKLSDYAGPYYRFIGGQDAGLNNGAALSSGVTLTGSLGSVPNVDGDDHGDGLLLFKKQNYKSVADIVVGNYNNNDTSPGSEPVRADMAYWLEEDVNSSNPYYSQWDMGGASEGYGQFYTDDDRATATFTPTIGAGGEYQVYEWHGWHGNSGGNDEASNVPYEIIISGSTAKSGAIDQKKDYGKWNLLGTYNFPAGESSSVKISASGANGVVIADAVKFVFTGNSTVTPPPPPPPVCNNNTICEPPGETTANCPNDCPPVTLKADLNCDNKVDVYDLGILMSCWGGAFINYPACKSGANLPATCNKSPDINGDGRVDVFDLGIMLSCWGTNNSPQCSTTAVIGPQTCDRCMAQTCGYYNSCSTDTGTNCGNGEFCCTGACSAPTPTAICDHCLPNTCNYYNDCYGDTGANCASGESCCSGTCGAPIAAAGSFYVATTGSDNPGVDGSLNNPWRTINFALNNAVVVAGSTIYVRAGNYNESVDSGAKSGQAGQLIAVRNYQNETVIIDGNNLGDKPCVDFKNSAYLKISGIKIVNCGNNGVWLGDYNVADGVEVFGVGKVSRGRGIVTENAQSAQILNSHIYDNKGVNGSDGIFLWNSDGALVRGNNIHDNSDDGIDGLEGVRGATIENNTIYNNSNDALKLGQFGNGPGHVPGNESQNNIVRNNLTYNNSYGLTITGFNNQVYNNTVSTGPSRSNTFVLSGRDNVVQNNIINASFWMRNGNAPPQTHNEVSMTIEYNLLYDGTVTTQDTTFLNFSIMCTRVAQGCNSVDANPLFINKAGADFHLQAASPAINSGITQPINYDLDNKPRPVGSGYDMGAYEYSNAAAPN